MSVQVRPAAQKPLLKQGLCVTETEGIERGRGRGTGRFPVVEILKPQGFKAQFRDLSRNEQ